MTQLLATAPDFAQLAGLETLGNENQQRFDALIAQNRLLVPPGVVEQRRRTRLTIGEINRLSLQGIQNGIDPIEEGDERSPAIRFLDLIDLPRNTVANAIFGDASFGQRLGAIGLQAGVGAAFGSFFPVIGTAVGAAVGAGIGILGQVAGEVFVGDEKQREITLASERRGTFAQPVIWTSDVLRSMGVENQVVRAVTGFVGDVLLDPLTYLSGGGNVATLTTRNGARIVFAKGGLKTIDDYAAELLRTGAKPVGAQYEPLHYILDSTIRVGDEFVDVSGRSGNIARDLLGAAERLNGVTPLTGASAKVVKAERKRIANILRQHLVAGLSDELGEVAAIGSRAWARHYAAVSARQFTFPFAGIIANAMRTSLDIPLGRFGRPAEFRRALGKTEREFAQRITKQRNAMLDRAIRSVKGVKEAKDAKTASLAAERLGNATPEEVGELTRRVIRAEIELDDARIARQRFDPTAFDLAAPGRLITERFSVGQIERTIEGMDNFMASMAHGDALVASAGPAALLAKLPWGFREWMENAERIASVNRVHNAERRQLTIQISNTRARLREVNAETELLAEAEELSVVGAARAANLAADEEDLRADLVQIQRMMDNSNAGRTQVIDELSVRQTEITHSSYAWLWRLAVRADDEVRAKLGRNTKHRAAREAMIRHRIANENMVPIRAQEVAAEFDADVAKIAESTGYSEDEIRLAILHRIMTNGQEAGKRAFQPEGVTGFSELMDVHIPSLYESLGAEGATRLLNEPTVLATARKYNTLTEDFHTIESGLGITPDFDVDFIYLQLGFTDDARKAIRAGARSRPVEGVALASDQPFTISRLTNRHFFTNPDTGELDTIWVGELIRAEHAANDLDPEQASRLDAFFRWRANERELRGDENWMPLAYQTDPWELNKQRVRFHKLVPIEAGANIFETNLRQIIVNRTMQHERAIANKRLSDDLVANAKIIEPHAAEAGVLPKSPLGGDDRILDGMRYRRLNSSAVRSSQLRIPIDDDRMHYWYPTVLADEIEDYAKRLRTRDDMNVLLLGTDGVLSVWKGVTLSHPSWWGVNVVGGAINSFASAATRPVHWARHAINFSPIIWKIHFRGIQSLSRKKLIQFGEDLVSEYDLGQKFLMNGAVSPQRAVIELINTGRVTGEDVLGLLKKKGHKLGEYWGNWFKFNAATDDLWRVITLADRIEQGDSFRAAQVAMVKAHFDYSDFTSFEQEVGTRVFPFARWMRNNMALQAHLLVQKPAYAASYPKLKQGLETAFVDENRVPENLRPRWMRDQLSVQLAKDPKAKFLLLSLFTPAQEMFEIGQSVFGPEGFVELLKYVVSSSNPILKIPFELSVGKEIFTGREIGDEDFGKISYFDYLAQQFRPYRDIRNVRRNLNREDFSVTDIGLRALIGGRLQQTSTERLEGRTAFETGETIRMLRSQIKRALRNEDEDEAQRLAVRLVEKYRMLWDIGIIDMVPRRLRAQFIRERNSR